MRFDWDPKKAAENLRKHGVSFEEATEVFLDPNALEGYDVSHSLKEARFFIIGLSTRRLLYVIYAERKDDLVRILSARKANTRESEFYEQTIKT
jgi:uncharacterized protein